MSIVMMGNAGAGGKLPAGVNFSACGRIRDANYLQDMPYISAGTSSGFDDVYQTVFEVSGISGSLYLLGAWTATSVGSSRLKLSIDGEVVVSDLYLRNASSSVWKSTEVINQGANGFALDFNNSLKVEIKCSAGGSAGCSVGYLEK